MSGCVALEVEDRSYRRLAHVTEPQRVAVAIHTLEIEHASIERERPPHAPATNGRDDRHQHLLDLAYPIDVVRLTPHLSCGRIK